MDADERELPLRDPRSVMFETDYWRALLEDVQALNDRVPPIGDALIEIPIAMLELVLGGDTRVATDRAGAAVRAALAALETLQEPIDRLLELATGRLVALREEAGLPPAEGEAL